MVGFNVDPLVGVYNTSIVATCPGSGAGPLIVAPSARAAVKILRAYRSVEQPLPGNHALCAVRNIANGDEVYMYKLRLWDTRACAVRNVLEMCT